jgi:hypothetical protein
VERFCSERQRIKTGQVNKAIESFLAVLLQQCQALWIQDVLDVLSVSCKIK